jgi:hypothetical protein
VFSQFKNLNFSVLMKGLLYGQVGVSAGASASQVANAKVSFDLYSALPQLADTQASMNLVHSVMRMITSQEKTDSKTFSEQMRAHSEEQEATLSEMGKFFNAVTQALKA